MNKNKVSVSVSVVGVMVCPNLLLPSVRAESKANAGHGTEWKNNLRIVAGVGKQRFDV